MLGQSTDFQGRTAAGLFQDMATDDSELGNKTVLEILPSLKLTDRAP